MKLEPFQLERYLAQHEFVAPHLLCCSDCESFSVTDILALAPGLRERFGNLKLGYTESVGSPELREAVAGLYAYIRPAEVLVHAGAEEAIFIFMNVCLSRGDHVIAHYPCYQSLFEIARAIGCDLTLWHTREEEQWELDLEFLKGHIRKETKAVIVNCPHNPTGYLMSHAKQRELVALSQKYGFVIFSDEVYRLLEYDPAHRLPAMCDLDERAVSLGVMSKSYGLAGLRIGWAATRNQELLERMAAFKDYTSICNSAPSEFLATAALQHQDRLVERNRGIIHKNRQELAAFMERYRSLMGWTEPKAGPIAFPYLKQAQDVNHFCDELRNTTGVLLLPGTVYEQSSRHFRIGFGRSNFSKGLAVLESYLNHQYP